MVKLSVPDNEDLLSGKFADGQRIVVDLTDSLFQSCNPFIQIIQTVFPLFFVHAGNSRAECKDDQ